MKSSLSPALGLCARKKEFFLWFGAYKLYEQNEDQQEKNKQKLAPAWHIHMGELSDEELKVIIT